MQSTAELRKQIRAKRNALSHRQQQAHSLVVARHFMRSGLFLRSDRIALYLAIDGELDLSHLERKLRHHGKETYLPSLRKHPRHSLRFIRFKSGDHLISNRFGIKEPETGQQNTTPPWRLDLILMPLVAFDRSGNRIGMGGGFYDRTLKYLSYRRVWRQPLLVGIGHECQRVSAVKTKSWDIPLDCAITEAGIYTFNSVRQSTKRSI